MSSSQNLGFSEHLADSNHEIFNKYDTKAKISSPAETSILEDEDDEVEDIAVVLLEEEIVLFFLHNHK